MLWPKANDRQLIFFFFFNDTATTEIYTLSLHDALPICNYKGQQRRADDSQDNSRRPRTPLAPIHINHQQPGQNPDRKSTRLNSSHSQISYAVFCLKKKKLTYAP